jgi:predicted Holliday junction resolvase-like endonuclease
MIIGMFLGMVMVLGILGVVVVVRMYSDIKKLKKRLRGQEEINQSIYRRFEELDQMINRRIDGEIRRTDELYTETNRYISSRADETHKGFEEVYRIMDSRLDKLTNKMSNPVKKDLLQD